jgi:uncharacterized protein YjbI with pentapeptide repeats
VRKQSAARQRAVAASLAFEFDEIRKQQSRRRSVMSTDQRTFRGTRAHLRLLERSLGSPRGGNEWNDWRGKHPRLRPNLRGANLSDLDLVVLDLAGVVLRGANLSGSKLSGVDLSGSDLRDAQGFNVDLNTASLKGCPFAGAWLHGWNFDNADLAGATFGGAILTDCSLNWAGLEGADLRGVNLWRCTSWGVMVDEHTVQSGIRVASDFDEFEFARLTTEGRKRRAADLFDFAIDDLRVADFVLQIRETPARVADMISAAAGRLVLLLGRFTGTQDAVLEKVLKPTLTARQYNPMVFDFSPPEGRDVIESVAILAGLSHFVIADLSDPRSTPLESQLLAPMLAIPFFPIVRRGDRVFSMFTDLQQKYPWVQPTQTYGGAAHLRRLLNEWIIPTAEREAKKWKRRKQHRVAR